MQGKWGVSTTGPWVISHPQACFPVWKSGLMITVGIQCSEVQDLECMGPGAQLVLSTWEWILLEQSSLDYPCEPKQDKVSEI